MKDPDLETVEAEILETRDHAVKLRDITFGSEDAWFPLSQVEFTRRNVKTGKCQARIPTWLLKKKGWV